MEYVEGTTLARLVKERAPLPPDEAAPLMRQAADALVAAHAAGIVHRDVKPSNILVDRSRQVKLTDFGIARIAADPPLTQTGLVTGSPAYLAPEVAAGGAATSAADVWSLGATLFHVLAGPAAVRHRRPRARQAVPHRQRGAAPAGRRRLDDAAARGARWSGTRRSAGRWRRSATSSPPEHVRAAVPCHRRSWLRPRRCRPTRRARGGAHTGAGPARTPRAPRPSGGSGGNGVRSCWPWWCCGALGLGVLLCALLPDDPGTEPPRSSRPTASPTRSPPRPPPARTAPRASPRHRASRRAPEPEAEADRVGHGVFVREYLAAVATDPDAVVARC